MKFIYADSLDYVDPRYDFVTDTNGDKRQPYWDDKFPHEILPRAPYDGILVSRATVGDFRSKGKYTEAQAMRFKRVGARKFLRFDNKLNLDKPIFGDCGSFSYAREDEPPYKPADTIEFYADGGFTHGCSIDHIIFDFNPDQSGLTGGNAQAKQRYQITLDLAAEFFIESKKLGKGFTPLGVAQGWSPGSLAASAKELLKIGYRYIAIGGLVPLSVEHSHLAIDAVENAIKAQRGAKMHLLGFAKADHLHEFKRYNRIASFDTTSPLLRAFKDSRKNYYQLDKKSKSFTYYTAIRVPQALENARLKAHAKTGRYEQEELLRLENAALTTLRSFDAGKADIEETLDAVINYSRPILWTKTITDEALERNVKSLKERYRTILEDKPWKKCKCAICKSVSIEVAVFRASNRNKRRGIHNLNSFYSHLQTLNNANI